MTHRMFNNPKYKESGFFERSGKGGMKVFWENLNKLYGTEPETIAKRTETDQGEAISKNCCVGSQK